MNIKILTFHFTRNYGATLQSFALSTYLKSLGHRVEIIDYLPNSILKEYSLLNLKNRPSSLFKTIIKFPFLLARNSMFNSFLRKNINLTKEKYYTLDDLQNSKIKADVFIVGSDQIWNSDITNGIDPVYYLDFVTTGLKISYAASFGKDSISENEILCIVEYLKRFSAISVREESTMSFLGKFINDIPLSHVLDPVFLLDRKDYLALFKERNTAEDYLFVYDVHENSKLFHVARKIARLKSLKIVAIARAHTPRSNVDKLIYLCGPSEFLRLIYNAKYIVTNSFHGTCFSMIMNKDFNVVPNNSLNERITNLLSKCRLNNRLITDEDTIISNPIDYSRINAILEKEKYESKKFLQNAINDKVILNSRKQYGG